MKYLDPKADLTFKRIFGEHADLLISLLNALLPLKEDEQVESLEYLTPEMAPETYLGKNSIVDVRCRDRQGRQFLVEMQMLWTPAFQQRVLFNASKAYVRQLDKSRRYEYLQPVYSLNLVNETFLNDYPDEFIHNYDVIHELHSDKVIEGLHFTFVELPKFKPRTIEEKKMAVLWLKFLTEIDENTEDAPKELLDNPDTNKALQEVQTMVYTKDELAAYEDFWDRMGADRLLVIDTARISHQQGKEEGRAEGRAEGLEEGLAKGREEGIEKGIAKGREEGLTQGREEGIAEGETQKALEIARAMLAKGLDAETIAELTKLTVDDVRKL